MRIVAALLFLLVASQLPAESFIELPTGHAPRFTSKAGRYEGSITVIERTPRPPSTALLPEPADGTFLETKAKARVTAAISGNRIRVVGQPGSALLGYLDEPSYASMSVDSIYANSYPAFVGLVAKSRNGIGEVAAQSNRVRMRFEVAKARADFAANEQTVTSTVLVEINLTRAGD